MMRFALWPGRSAVKMPCGRRGKKQRPDPEEPGPGRHARPV